MNVTIRPWRNKDLQQLVKIADNILVWNNLRNYFPNPYSITDGECWLNAVANENPIHNFAIQANEEVAGGIGLVLNEDVYAKSAELGYWLGQSFWQQGIATKAVRLITDYAFTHFDIIRLYAQVFEINKASMKVLEKNGYHLEGIRKKAIYKNNVLMDDYVWVKFKEGTIIDYET